MAKKSDRMPVSVSDRSQAAVEDKRAGAAGKASVVWYHKFTVQAIVVAALAFISYFNTFKNEYALDDLIVIVSNEYVYEGFAGLPDIFTKDAFYSYCKTQSNSANQLAGGRYRPLSIATFAVEQQFLGAVPREQIDSVMLHAREPGPQETKLIQNMHARHVFNVLWYVLAVVILLYFLRYVVFPHDPLMAFVAAILFTVHPIHTEVVANVKSRGEILSLLFLCSTFIFAFKYREHKKIWLLVAALSCFFMALLSREYGVSMALLLPVAFYVFMRDSWGKSLLYSLPFWGVLVLYLFIRFQVIGTPNGSQESDDIWNNPYALATGSERLATEISTMLNYVKLLFFPYPLSSDYSYNTIPYKSFSHPLVWLSLLVHLLLIAALFYYLRKRSALAFAIAFYFFNLLLVSNIFVNIGGTMGERLIYHSSVGFAIAIAYFLVKGKEMLRSPGLGDAALAGVCVLIIVVGVYRTMERNPDWKNDLTLMSHDVKVVPNSLLVNTNLGVALLSTVDFEKDEKKKEELLHQGISFLNKSISLDSNNIPSYLNKGLSFFRLKEADSAKSSYDKVIKLMPDYQRLPEMYYNVGVLYYFEKRYQEAINVWQTVLRLQPSYSAAQKNIYIALQDMKNAGK
jgi:protein O-mannosyl-transferase